MKIRDIQIDGFGVWSGLSVDSLPGSMVVFYGPNEAGKTTLMQFLRAMFYGFTPERRMRYLPPVHGGKPGGVMRVTGPGGGYEISRRAQLDAETVVGQLAVTSSDGVSQGQHRLSTLLGNIDERIFSNVFAIGLRELQELNTLDDTAAADELYKLSSGLDRVSLVDVIRKLKSARNQIVAPNSERGQMQAIMLRRDKLREELEQLNSRSRRWSELAAIRKSQQKEIQELRTRIETLSLEAKTIELAIQAREPWKQRSQLRDSVKQLNARLDLPDDADVKLKKLQQEIEEKRLVIEELKEQRDTIRREADQLPLNKGIMQLATRIDVANEQGPWITALQKQIHQLNTQVHEARDSLLENAKRLGLSEEDQQSLINDKRMANLPDLSSQAIAQLAGPAKDVRNYQLRLKQAKVHLESESKEVSKLQEKVQHFLDVRNQSDLPSALDAQQQLLNSLRSLAQSEQTIANLIKHRKELDSEAVNLETYQTIPMERMGFFGILFVAGGSLMSIGLLSLGTKFADGVIGNSTAMMMTFFGAILLMFWYMWLQLDQKTAIGDLDECESEIDGFTAQIRKHESERDEMLKRLPEHGGSVEQRIRDAESELHAMESLLPISHNLEAASMRLQSLKREAKEANSGLRSSIGHWKRTLQNLGLAESLSPKSIRIMAEGYESLVQSRRRLKAREDELEQRRIELTSIDAKIDSLLRQVLALNGAAASAANAKLASRDVSPTDRTQVSKDKYQTPAPQKGKERQDYKPAQPVSVSLSNASAGYDTTDSTTDKLARLQSIVAGQQQFIAKRRELKSDFDELVRKHKAVRKSMERLTRSRDSLLAELSVENTNQLATLLGKKQEHHKLVDQIEEREARIQAILGGNVPYEVVSRLLENVQAASELEKRWEVISQHTGQAEQRVAQLLERQGETQQEMKTIAGDRRLLEIKTELSVLDRQLELTAEHWRTLGFTSSMLNRVCEIYETERQPETLREASVFLKQLTDGKYRRVWTPLGKNALRVENDKGQDLPIEVLSRGTREAVFIALRLSLAAAYARRGVTLPLILDDVLVNFDSERAKHAATVLRDFSQLGHQTVFFTCHEHIMRMFHEIDVEVRVLPGQGKSGEAKVYHPEPEIYDDYVEPEYIESVVEEPVAAEPVIEQEIVEEVIEVPATSNPVAQEIVETIVEDIPPPAPEVDAAPRRVRSQPKPYRETVYESEPSIDHLWYERDVPVRQPQKLEPEYAQLESDLNDLNSTWLDSQSVPGVAWDWDTMSIESANADTAQHFDRDKLNQELGHQSGSLPSWWKR
jgi:uncharacterized protein YhaN